MRYSFVLIACLLIVDMSIVFGSEADLPDSSKAIYFIPTTMLRSNKCAWAFKDSLKRENYAYRWHTPLYSDPNQSFMIFLELLRSGYGINYIGTHGESDGNIVVQQYDDSISCVENRNSLCDTIYNSIIVNNSVGKWFFSGDTLWGLLTDCDSLKVFTDTTIKNITVVNSCYSGRKDVGWLNAGAIAFAGHDFTFWTDYYEQYFFDMLNNLEGKNGNECRAIKSLLYSGFTVSGNDSALIAPFITDISIGEGDTIRLEEGDSECISLCFSNHMDTLSAGSLSNYLFTTSGQFEMGNNSCWAYDNLVEMQITQKYKRSYLCTLNVEEGFRAKNGMGLDLDNEDDGCENDTLTMDFYVDGTPVDIIVDAYIMADTLYIETDKKLFYDSLMIVGKIGSRDSTGSFYRKTKIDSNYERIEIYAGDITEAYVSIYARDSVVGVWGEENVLKRIPYESEVESIHVKLVVNDEYKTIAQGYKAQLDSFGLPMTIELCESENQRNTKDSLDNFEGYTVICMDSSNTYQYKYGEKSEQDRVLILAAKCLDEIIIDFIEAYANELEYHWDFKDAVKLQYINFPGTDDSSDVMDIINNSEAEYVILIGDFYEDNQLDTIYNRITTMPLPWEIISANCVGRDSTGASTFGIERGVGQDTLGKCVGVLRAKTNMGVLVYLQKSMAGYYNSSWGYENRLVKYINNADGTNCTGEQIMGGMQKIDESIHPWFEVEEKYKADITNAALPCTTISIFNRGCNILYMEGTKSNNGQACYLITVADDTVFSALSESGKMSHVAAFSCLTCGIDAPTYGALAKMMMIYNGGALTCLGTTKGYYQTGHQRFSEEFLKSIKHVNVSTIGRVVRNTKNRYLEKYGEDRYIGEYPKIVVLQGDPTIPIVGPYSNAMTSVAVGREKEEVKVKVLPNPFNGVTRIDVEVDRDTWRGKVGIYNVQGRLVREVWLEVNKGRGEVEWDGRDDRGRLVSSGIYLYRIVMGGRVMKGKMCYLR